MAEENGKLNEQDAGVSINMNSAPSEPQNTPVNGAEMPAQSQTLYSSDDPSNDQADLKKAGFDLDIKQTRPEDNLNSSEENVVDSIVKQATVDKDEEQKILDELETMDPSFSADVPVAPIAEHGAKMARNIFIAILLVAALAVGYFYITQKGIPLIGLQANTTLAEAETQLNDIKKEAVANDLVNAALEYRNLAYIGGVYSIELQNSDVKSKKDLEAALSSFKKNLEEVNDQFQSSEGVVESILVSLSDKSRQLKEELKIAKNQREKDQINLDIALLSEGQRIAKTLLDQMGNPSEGLIAAVAVLSEGGYEDQEFMNKLDALFKQYKFNEYAKVAHIQSSRVNWTEVINEIESVTKSIDPFFNFDGTINGDGISYSAFAFNRDSNRVNITGQTRTSDIKTFTLIADLTDAFEQSPMFSIHDSRTYSKQPDQDEGYKAAITLDVVLESKES